MIAEHAVVASESPLASVSGYDILRSGGNAFDAAVAVSFTLAVTMHHLGGLGGDFFGMFYEAKTGRVHCLNSSGWSPSGLTAELVRSSGEERVPPYGALSCVVPGLVGGVCSMHSRFGDLAFGGLLSAAASYARDGFPATDGYCRSTAASLDSLSPQARSTFAPGGRSPVPGDVIKQGRLADVIDEIASGGSEAFYGGRAGDSMADALQRLGVPADPADFRGFRPEWVTPLQLEYGGARVFEVPPNSMGATSLLMLKLLSESRLGSVGPLSRERVAATLDAAEVAYARRDRMLGDPRFGSLDMEEFMRPPRPGERFSGEVREGDTTAFSVADREGNLVSAIQSLFRHFGSRVFVDDCGIVLNDRGSGFAMAGPNKVEPRKRPLHTLSTMIVEAGDDRRVAIGASGGEYRPMQHTLFVTNMTDYGMSLEGAVDHPRFLWSEGRGLLIEEGYEKVAGKRYDVLSLPMPGRTGVCQAVELAGGVRKAVCDVRGDGLPVGF